MVTTREEGKGEKGRPTSGAVVIFALPFFNSAGSVQERKKKGRRGKRRRRH